MNKPISKIMIAFILLTLTLITVPFVKANSGPPVNVEITITNFDVDFSFDFLILRDTPPTEAEISAAQTLITEKKHYPFDNSYFNEDYALYQDSEGYISGMLYSDINYFYLNTFNPDKYYAQAWMNVPREFKILLYTSEGKIITSELITMSQFDFRLTYDLTGVDMSTNQTNVGTISGFIGNPWKNITTWVNFLLRLTLTLFIEIAILALFQFKKKWTFYKIILLNIFTQIVLNIVIISVFYLSYDNSYSFVFTFIVGEILVFLVEGIFTVLFIKEKRTWIKMTYSFTANAVSLIVGLLVASSLSFII